MSINKQLTYIQAVDNGNDSWVSNITADCGMEVNASLERRDSALVMYQVLPGVKHDVLDQEDPAEYSKGDIMEPTGEDTKTAVILAVHCVHVYGMPVRGKKYMRDRWLNMYSRNVGTIQTRGANPRISSKVTRVLTTLVS